MPVPCYVYTKVQKKNYVWKIEGRCKRDHKMTVYNAIIETQKLQKEQSAQIMYIYA